MSTDTLPSLPSDVPAFLDSLGGVGKIAEATGIPLGTVSAWKTRKRIPFDIDNWQKVIDLAKAKGRPDFDANALVAIHVGAPAAVVPA
jgi:hypothetical protein